MSYVVSSNIRFDISIGIYSAIAFSDIIISSTINPCGPLTGIPPANQTGIGQSPSDASNSHPWLPNSSLISTFSMLIAFVGHVISNSPDIIVFSFGISIWIVSCTVSPGLADIVGMYIPISKYSHDSSMIMASGL